MNELDAIRARRAAITPGEWWVEYRDASFYEGEECTNAVVTTHDGDIAGLGAEEQCRADAAFIAAAPDDITALLAMVDRLTGEREALNMWCDEWKRRADELTAQLAAERDAAKRHAAYIASCVDECDSYIP